MESKLKAGDILGPYRVVRYIGRGGMGEVYEAFEERLARKVALKLISPKNREADANVITRFMQEGQALAQIHHQNVVSVFAIDEIDEHKFMAMEFIEGLPIDALRRRFIFDSRDAGNLMVQMLEGLKALHQKNIVHRDIKPGNIILQKNGAMKFIDFGLARRLDKEGAEGQSENAGFYGTPRYLAPEVAAGAEASVSSDIFCLGMVFYELFAGERLVDPKAELSAKQIFKSYQTFRFVPSDQMRRLATGPGLKVLRKMLEPRPHNRYKSAAHVLEDLRPLVKNSRKLNDPLFLNICKPSVNYNETYKYLIERKRHSPFAAKRILTMALSNPDYTKENGENFEYSKNMIETAERRYEKLFDVQSILAASGMNSSSTAIKIHGKKGLGNWLKRYAITLAVLLIMAGLAKTELGKGVVASKVSRTISSLMSLEPISKVPESAFPNGHLVWFTKTGLTEEPFEWPFDFHLDDQAILEVASDVSFTKTQVKYAVTGSSAAVRLRDPGRYHWRIYDKDGLKVGPFSFSAEGPSPPKLLSPGQNSKFSADLSENGYPKPYTINFFWRKKQFASSYVLEISLQDDFQNVMLRRSINSGQSAKENLTRGRYYWRMRADRKDEKVARWSEVRSFVIK